MQSETGSIRLFKCCKPDPAKVKIIIGVIFLMFAVNLQAGSVLKDRVTVALSQPDIPGLLRINHYKGSIRVRGYNGKTVIVSAAYRQNKAGQGLKWISKSLELSAVEQNNEVTVHTDSQRRTIDLDILIPREFSLKLQTYDNGGIEVTDVKGEMEINNTNGPILMLRVSGSAVLSTVDGDILVKFIKITPDIPMAFTSIEGDIDITFPTNVNGRLKMKANNGDVFSDEKLEINKQKYPARKNYTNILKSDWSVGLLNQGGAEYLIKTLNGNIYIRLQNDSK